MHLCSENLKSIVNRDMQGVGKWRGGGGERQILYISYIKC